MITWGDPNAGGDSSAITADLNSNVSRVFSTQSAFAALLDDGSVVTWGDLGGDSTAVQDQLTSGVTNVFSNQGAFVALKDDGSVVTWGDPANGGEISESSYEPRTVQPLTEVLSSGVVDIVSTNSASAFALVSDLLTMSLLFASMDALAFLTKSSYAFCATSSLRIASASITFASSIICCIILMAPPEAWFFLYTSKLACGGGPAGS